MKIKCSFSNSAYIFALTLMALAVPIKSAAADPAFIVDSQVGQATSDTCQSYVLAIALAFARDPGFPLLSWSNLRKTELGVRAQIEAAFRKRNPGAATVQPTHEDVKAGFEAFTGGTYKLNFADVDIVGLSNAVASKTGVTNAAAVPANFVLSSVTKNVILTSATRIGSNSYKNGHLFSIFGMDGPPNSSRRYLILNSAVKQKDTSRNACRSDFPDEPGPYTAVLNWRSSPEIDFKLFGSSFRMWTIEKAK